MRILNEDSNKSVNRIVLYLTHVEALELLNDLNEIIKKPKNNHAHIFSEDLQKEVTICIYDKTGLHGFNERSLDLIINDE